MKIEIKHWYSGATLFQGEYEDLKAALEAASIDGARLDGASLDKHTVLPTTESWEVYLAEVVPALCTAGGRTLEDVAAAWDCHSLDNCPMAVAFGVHSAEEAPVLHRPRIRQFIQFYDAKLIPRPEVAHAAG